MFNVIYWIFGFLRMGTSGMTSQALGARRLDETVRMLVRSAAIAAGIAVLLIIMQYPMREAALLFMNPTDEVRRFSTVYYNICIWGAPAMLGLFALSGWSIGMQNSRIPMVVAIVQNIVNIVASLLLVFVCGLKVEGVAFGTLIAQYAGFTVAALLIVRSYGRLLRRHFSWSGVWQRESMISFFNVNRDIFLRTVCLVCSPLMSWTVSHTQERHWAGNTTVRGI